MNETQTRIRQLLAAAKHARERQQLRHLELCTLHGLEPGTYGWDLMSCVIYDGWDYEQAWRQIQQRIAQGID